MGSRPLDQISAESRAVLSLILLQSRSYGDIANLLRLGYDEIRERAHLAARQLVTTGSEPDPDTQVWIIDYVLGEQTVSERAQTRSALLSDEAARRWANELVEALAPLARAPLPAIPTTALDASDAPLADAPTAVQPDLPPAKVAPVTPEPATRPAGTVAAATPIGADRPSRSRRVPVVRSARFAVPTLVVIVVAIVAVVLLGGGGSSGGSSGPANGALPRRFVLASAGSEPRARGTATIERRKGALLLFIRAGGLTANTPRNSYGVWLFNSPSSARLLGFVSPSVGSSGAFYTGAALPADAFSFHSLVVTLETSSQPSRPGPTVLRGSLSSS